MRVCVWVGGGLNSINLASNEMSSANLNVTERLVSSKNSLSLGGGHIAYRSLHI